MKAKIKTIFSPLIIGLIIGVLFTSTSAFAVYFLAIKPKLTPPVSNITPSPQPSPTITATNTPIPTDNSEFGTLHWYSAPKKVSNPNILLGSTSPDFGGFDFADPGTYRVAEFSSGASLLVSFILPEGPSSPVPFRLISDKGKYYLIESLIADEYYKKDIDKIFNFTKVKPIVYQIKDLYPDPFYFVKQTNFSKDGSFMPAVFTTELKNPTVFGSTPVGDLLFVDSPLSDYSGLSTRTYYLRLKDFTLLAFSRNSRFGSTDTKVPYFNNLDGSPNKVTYSAPKTGCGSGQELVINSSLTNGRASIGRDGQGQELFRLTSSDNLVVKYVYDQYKIGRDYPSAPPILTLNQFMDAPAYLIYQENNGDWLLLVNPDYAIQAECGKPVIYLYPTKDTQVSVKVGADITKSQPLYSQNGWTVLAHPNGQLDYQGKSYPNLFWEGTGWGIYPDTNQGFVVSQKDLISTLKNHLKLLGLNNQESADFMEFWTPKLPTTPFIRLTWFSTTDMNRLAPLSVTPQPDTVIRIFLDFAGLDKSVSLIPQKLSSPPRHGFTLVEWGGLLVK